MQALAPESVAWCLAVLQVLGLASAWLARVGERSDSHRWYQRVFFGFLLLISVATLGALQIGPGAGIGSAATLAVMVLAATWDFSSHREPAV